MSEDFVDGVIRLNDFLDSIIGLVKKFLVVGAVVGAVAIAVIVDLSPLASQRPFEFALLCVLLIVAGALVGATITLLAAKGRTKGQIETRDHIITDKDAEIARLTDEKLALQKQLANANSEWKSKVAAREFDIASLKMELAKAKDSEQERPEQEQVRTPSGRLCRNMTAVRQLPTETIEAMLDAFDHGGVCELAEHEKWVRSSIKSGDGVFYLDTLHFMGQSTGEETGRYWLTNEWRGFMDDANVIAGMRDIVRSAGPVWHEI